MRTARYALAGVPEDGTLVYKMPGYRLGVIPIDARDGQGRRADAVRRPARSTRPRRSSRAPGRLDAMLALHRPDRGERHGHRRQGDRRTPLLRHRPARRRPRSGAVREAPIFDLEELLPTLKERGIYTIARMVVMKDNTSAVARPELAVRNSATGEPWRDNIGGAWLDPSATRAWPSTSPRSPATWPPRASTRSSSTTSASSATARTTWPTRTCRTRSRSGCRPSSASCGWSARELACHAHVPLGGRLPDQRSSSPTTRASASGRR